MNFVASTNACRCRVLGLRDRRDEHITEENCTEKIESFGMHWQRVRVLGRPVRGVAEYYVLAP